MEHNFIYNTLLKFDVLAVKDMPVETVCFRFADHI